jgi:hypothetical protein
LRNLAKLTVPLGWEEHWHNLIGFITPSSLLVWHLRRDLLTCTDDVRQALEAGPHGWVHALVSVTCTICKRRVLCPKSCSNVGVCFHCHVTTQIAPGVCPKGTPWVFWQGSMTRRVSWKSREDPKNKNATDMELPQTSLY